CLPGRRMEFTQITDYNRLTKNKFGILENWQSQSTINNEPDIIIVPGLAFKSDGYRLGFGGGYYDRFLAEHDLMSISMVGSLRLIEQSCWPINDYDIPVKKLITIE
ncbi:MAG: 5-formyltetrahydrofolate cyclo-ligase, partial [Lactobacillus iners]|nr:5-formyltetrahydrofolate cyclo-ligase [Lactobacillus iners]MCT7809218.1 5-formyltetrahydrofolate cyclo-ligase [Lactobacillus iners]